MRHFHFEDRTGRTTTGVKRMTHSVKTSAENGYQINVIDL